VSSYSLVQPPQAGSEREQLTEEVAALQRELKDNQKKVEKGEVALKRAQKDHREALQVGIPSVEYTCKIP